MSVSALNVSIPGHMLGPWLRLSHSSPLLYASKSRIDPATECETRSIYGSTENEQAYLRRCRRP